MQPFSSIDQSSTMPPLSFLSVFLAFFSFSQADGPLKIHLVHRDRVSHRTTHSDRLYAAFNRSFSRLTHFRRALNLSNSKILQSDLVPSGGEYYMRISVGTPPLYVLGIADTGSDLTWIQCKPCKQCYDQKDPIFDPTRSSTYKHVACESDTCRKIEPSDRSCDPNQGSCGYSYSYGDRSFTRGDVALDNFTLSNSSFSSVIFGCGHKNGGTFDEIGSGIIGLGGGPLSLVSQLRSSIGAKFSYCLAPNTPTSPGKSKIFFGGRNSTVNSSPGQNAAVSTQLVDKDPSTYYYVTLEGISVGSKRLTYRSSWAGNGKGNVIVDSGTTLTFVDDEFYTELESAVAAAVGAKRASDPRGLLSLCFQGSSEEKMDLPAITLHFSGAAELKLRAANVFAQVEEGLVCFTIIPSSDVAIIGNLAQMDYMVGYDLGERSLSFVPQDCNKF